MQLNAAVSRTGFGELYIFLCGQIYLPFFVSIEEKEKVAKPLGSSNNSMGNHSKFSKAFVPLLGETFFNTAEQRFKPR